jgi:sulfofructose kinase
VPSSTHIDVVGLGLNATDTLISVSGIPETGSKAVVGSLTVLPGGQVATALIACQHWGLQTRYIGKLGDDPAAATHRAAFATAKVETQIVTVPNCPSAQSFIVVDATGERTVLWHRDPRLAIEPAELDREWIVPAGALLVDGRDTSAATQATQWARAAKISVIADLDEVYPGIESLLENVDYLIVNRDFPARLSGKSDLQESLPALRLRFRSRLAAATLGIGGALAWDGNQFYYAAAYRVPTVDTTGAGDIFHAGFIYGLLQHWPMQRILDFACAAAALNCTASGARGAIKSVEEIESLIADEQRYPAAYDCPARQRRKQ